MHCWITLLWLLEQESFRKGLRELLDIGEIRRILERTQSVEKQGESEGSGTLDVLDILTAQRVKDLFQKDPCLFSR